MPISHRVGGIGSQFSRHNNIACVPQHLEFEFACLQAYLMIVLSGCLPRRVRM